MNRIPRSRQFFLTPSLHPQATLADQEAHDRWLGHVEAGRIGEGARPPVTRELTPEERHPFRGCTVRQLTEEPRARPAEFR